MSNPFRLPQYWSLFSVRDAMNKLIALFPNDPYARYKAAGALGGASNHGCLSLDNNGVWIRIK